MGDKLTTVNSYLTAMWMYVFGTLTLQQWVALAGLLIGVLSLISSVYFKWMHLKLAIRQVERQQP